MGQIMGGMINNELGFILEKIIKRKKPAVNNSYPSIAGSEA